MRREIGYIGMEIETIILNDEGNVVDAFREIVKKLPKRERGRKHINIERSRVIHDIWGSQPEINVMPFWEHQFEEFHRELSSLLIDLYEAGRSLGYHVCLLPLPPKGHSDPLINKIHPRDAETQSIHFHYSKGGGFPDRPSRLPYYNAFVLTYLVILPTTLSSFYGFGKTRKHLGARYNLATALYPPPYIDINKVIDYSYMLKEIEAMTKELGLVHPLPENIRLFDVSFLTKEEAYWLVPRKSTVELRPFDTVPSILIMEAIWLLIAAIGKKVIKNEAAFVKVKRDAFRTLWRLRQRVVKFGFKAKIPKVDPEVLPVIDGERWPRFLYDDEAIYVKDGLMWLLDDLKNELEEIGAYYGTAKQVLSRFESFVREGRTPSERLMKKLKGKDKVKGLLEVCRRAVLDPFYVP